MLTYHIPIKPSEFWLLIIILLEVWLLCHKSSKSIPSDTSLEQFSIFFTFTKFKHQNRMCILLKQYGALSQWLWNVQLLLIIIIFLVVTKHLWQNSWNKNDGNDKTLFSFGWITLTEIISLVKFLFLWKNSSILFSMSYELLESDELHKVLFSDST